MKNKLLYTLLAVFFILSSCEQKSVYTLTIENTLDIPRSFETTEINKADLTLKANEDFSKLALQDVETKAILVSQFVDEDQDGNVDVILFQPEIGAKSKKQFQLVFIDEDTKPKRIDYCYSRFVPERTDDYAWENDKVAFRTYGPTAQKMTEDALKGGTLSSGIDAWLKRVDYPIINKWYEKTTTGKGSYHEDTGEGLDNFHAGSSRGIGGIAVKKDTTYYVSKNFTNWKTITTGPIRTSFFLEYKNWDANGQTITEKKHVSLDFGSNLSKIEIEISGTDNFYSGLTLHENDGEPTQNNEAGWISYWEPHEDSELGTAIVVPNDNMMSSELFVTTLKDQSHLFAQIKVNKQIGMYYAGFGWKKSKQFKTKVAWENYLNDFSLKINNPITIIFN
jgi:hypothetical protein